MLNKQINNGADVRAFLEYLREKGWEFHLDDDVFDICWNGCTQVPNDNELKLLDIRRDECFAACEDPHEIAIEVFA